MQLSRAASRIGRRLAAIAVQAPGPSGPPPPGVVRADRALVALALAAGLFVLGAPEADPDLWGHLRFGADTLTHGWPARADPYAYVTGRVPWINHEWLSEALMAAIYRALGPAGLVLLPLGAAFTIATAGFRIARRAGLTLPAAVFWMAALFTQIKPGLGTVRPHLFTYVAFLALLLILRGADRGREARLWFAVPLFALWANLHGGFLAGAGLLVLWGLVVSVQRRRTRRDTLRTIWLPLGAALAATLATPYGWRLWWFLRTALVARPEISEWQPLVAVSGRGAAFAAVVAVCLWALVVDRRRVRPTTWALWIITTLLPLSAVRHTPLVGLACAVLVAPHLAAALRRRLPDPPRREAEPSAWVPGVLGLAACLLAALAIRPLGCIAILDPYPASAVRLLAATRVAGNLATTFNWGEYIIWHLGPTVRVSIDGRRETVYGDDAYRRSLAFIQGSGDWDALLREEATDMALVAATGPADHALVGDPGWMLVLRTDVEALYGRREFAGLPRLMAARPDSHPPARCFPGP